MQHERPVVFLVDDDLSVLRSLSRALEIHGLEVKAFASAEEFLNAYNNEHGCLVLDLSLPEKGGFELQAELKQQECEIPIIFITGQGGIPDSVKALRAGAIDFLEKPFKTERLLVSIDEAVQRDALCRASMQQKHNMQKRISNLTNREVVVLKLLLERDEFPSSKEIARILDISHRTVEHHRSRLLEKIGASSVYELRTLLEGFHLND